MKFRRLEVPKSVEKAIASANAGDDVKDVECWETDCGIGIIKTLDNTPKWGWLKHVSISRADRYPTWHEIQEVKEKFFGDNETAIMVLPKKELYVNVHPNCFHCWQEPQEWNLM